MADIALASSLVRRVEEVERAADHAREIAVKERDELFQRTEKLLDQLANLALGVVRQSAQTDNLHGRVDGIVADLDTLDHGLDAVVGRVMALEQPSRGQRLKAWIRENVYDGRPTYADFKAWLLEDSDVVRADW